jgi:PAS domain S-box-containing protein
MAAPHVDNAINSMHPVTPADAPAMLLGPDLGRPDLLMEKHHSCINTRAIIEYFQERAPDAVPRLISGLGADIDDLDRPLEFLMEVNNWVSSQVVIRMFANARDITGDDRIAYDIGFESATRKKLGWVQRIVLFAYKNPRRTLARVQAINDKFNRNKQIEVVDTTRDSAVVRLHWFDHVPGIRDFCLFNQGIYSGIPTIWNLPPAQLQETRCYFQGDDCCEYHMRWQRGVGLKAAVRRFLAPWKLLKSTISELERDKELLKTKFDQVHRLNLQLAQKINQLLCLHQNGMMALAAQQPDELAQASLQLLLQRFNLERSGVFWLNHETHALELKYAAGAPADMAARLKGETISLAQQQHPLVMTILKGYTQVFPGSLAQAFDGVRPDFRTAPSMVSVFAPLTVHQQVKGVLWGERAMALGDITRSDQEFFGSFANQLAMALDYARLHQELQLSERKYRGLVQNAYEGIWILDEQGVIQFSNRRMEEVSGVNQMTGRHFSEFWEAASRDRAKDIFGRLAQGEVVQEELEFATPDRGAVAVLMSAVPLQEAGRCLGSFSMFSDISGIRDMERQLRQHQKMEAVVALAGGIAHNFNNILMNIMGLTGLLLGRSDLDAPVHQDIRRIEEEAAKGSKLIKQLTSLSQGRPRRPERLDLNGLAARTLELFCRTRGQFQVNPDLSPQLPAVEVDAAQMEEVLLNLLVNAGHAMDGRGTIAVATAVVNLSEDFCRPHGRSAGPYVHLSISDTGRGMDQATLGRIFEPYFTTKPKGQGAGLGLATVYAMVQQHHGIITVFSQPGIGTTFNLYFPAAPDLQDAPASANAASQPRPSLVLLVDDDRTVAELAQRLLEKMGRQVLWAEDGPQALALYQQHLGQVDVVLLDLNLPGMSGKEVLRRLKEKDPAVRVLMVSADEPDGGAGRLLQAGALGFLLKPLRLTTLARKLAEVSPGDLSSPMGGTAPPEPLAHP